MSSYLDLDAIEAEQSLVMSTFFTGVRGLGRLMDPSTMDTDLKPDTSVDVPLWLAARLAKQSMVVLDLPPVYCDRYKKKMDAGPECMNLRARAPHFYTVGCALYEQYQLLVCDSLGAQAGNTVLKTMNKLCAEEQQGFEKGTESVQAYQRWLHGGPKLAKRKRVNAKQDKENQPPPEMLLHKK